MQKIRREHSAGTPCFWGLSSRTGRVNLSCFRSPSLWVFITAATNTKVCSSACELEELTPVEERRYMTNMTFHLRVSVLGGMSLNAHPWSQVEGGLRIKAKVPESSQLSKTAPHSLCGFSQAEKVYVFRRTCMHIYICVSIRIGICMFVHM